MCRRLDVEANVNVSDFPQQKHDEFWQSRLTFFPFSVQCVLSLFSNKITLQDFRVHGKGRA